MWGSHNRRYSAALSIANINTRKTTVAPVAANAGSQSAPTRKNMARAAAKLIPETTTMREMTVGSGIWRVDSGASSSGSVSVELSSCTTGVPRAIVHDNIVPSAVSGRKGRAAPLVGVGGFEPPASWPQTRRSSLAELHPEPWIQDKDSPAGPSIEVPGATAAPSEARRDRFTSTAPPAVSLTTFTVSARSGDPE